MSLPIEFRLAIGASCSHSQMDGTLILSLCARDPWMDNDHKGDLVRVTVHDAADPDFAVRIANSPANPRTLYSTGYGVRLAWDIDIRVRTSRLGVLQMDANPRPEINDGSLWHLAAILASSRTTTDFEPHTLFPPYLWLTTNYQHWREQWFPVEVDPANSTINALEFNPETKTQERVMHVRLVSRDPYRIALPEYVPSLDVFDIPGIIVTSMPTTEPGTGALAGAFVTQLTLSQGLPTSLPQAPDGVDLQDSLLVNLNASKYGWKLFTIQSIDNAERTLVTVSTLTELAGSYAIPPAPQCDAVRGVLQNRHYFIPQYCVVPFTGSAPPMAQTPFVGAKLIGGLGCPPG